MRTFEYRLYHNRAQRQRLMACLIESRAIYNDMLAALKAQYTADGTFPSKYDLTATFKGRGGEAVPATAVQTLADRLSKALKRFLQIKDLGASVGFPRFKTAKHYAERYSRVCVEDLNITGMVKNHHLARSIHDASWSAFLGILTDKAERAGHVVIRVPARFTTQKCSRCGAYVQKSLGVRTHMCASCGYIADRDVNAAKNILRAGAPPSGTGADGLPVELRSPGP
jgi:putative transposase